MLSGLCESNGMWAIKPARAHAASSVRREIGVSVHLQRSGARVLGGVGLLVGVIFSANVFAPPLMFATMLTLPFWLIVLGAHLRRTTAAATTLHSAAGVATSP